VRAVLARAKSAALKIRNDFQRGMVLEEIGAAEAKAGLLDIAVVTANRAEPHTLAILKAIGQELGNSNDLPRAEALGLRLSAGSAPSLFGFMARRQAEKGNIDDALRTTKHIRAPEVRSYALEGIAEQQAVKGDYDEVRKTLALARATDPNWHSDRYDVELMIAMGHLSRGNLETARTAIGAMKSRGSRFSSLSAGAETLLRAGNKNAAAAWLESAFEILPTGSASDFWRYLTIPLQVRLGQQERAMQAVAGLAPGLRVNGYVAVAVTCAEMKDVACANVALAKMKSAARLVRESETSLDFALQLESLNVSAALVESGQFEAASGLLTSIEQLIDDTNVSSKSIEARAQLQRVFMLARQDRFDDARSLALKIRENSVSDAERGTALRTIALLQTKRNGIALPQQWATALTDTEDRTYAFLGVAQGLLEFADPKLSYSAIRIH
jgi:tetratricopeptide (TPR) repeat protein